MQIRDYFTTFTLQTQSLTCSLGRCIIENFIMKTIRVPLWNMAHVLVSLFSLTSVQEFAMNTAPPIEWVVIAVSSHFLSTSKDDDSTTSLVTLF